MNDQAFKMLSGSVKKDAKHPVTVLLTQEQAFKLKAIASEYNTNVASLLRVAIKVTYGVDITDDSSQEAA